RVCQFLHGVGAAASSTFVFPSAARVLVRVFFEVRTLLPTLDFRVATLKGVGACSGTLPASIRHVLVLSYAFHCVLRFPRIVRNTNASASIIDQLVHLFRLLHISLIVHAGECARFVDGLRICPRIAENQQGGGHGREQQFERHVYFSPSWQTSDWPTEPSRSGSQGRIGRDPDQAHAGRRNRQRRTPVEGGHAGEQSEMERTSRLLKRRRRCVYLRLCDYSRLVMPPATCHSDCS